MSENTPLEKMTFEESLVELEEIVRNLESGKSPLDQSISAYERGTALKKHCETKLQEAQLKIEKITVGPDGKISLEASDIQH